MGLPNSTLGGGIGTETLWDRLQVMEKHIMDNSMVNRTTPIGRSVEREKKYRQRNEGQAIAIGKAWPFYCFFVDSHLFPTVARRTNGLSIRLAVGSVVSITGSVVDSVEDSSSIILNHMQLPAKTCNLPQVS